MKVLLDTHAFLWFIRGDPRLSAPARDAILDPSAERWLSVASLWEMAINVSLGRLTLGLSLDDLVRQHVEGNGMSVRPVRTTGLDVLAALPFHHKDPFDRLLLAQALTDDATVISRDEAFPPYGARLLWNPSVRPDAAPSVDE